MYGVGPVQSPSRITLKETARYIVRPKPIKGLRLAVVSRLLPWYVLTVLLFGSQENRDGK